MSDKDLYQQKMQARLDEWNAELDKLRAQASRASAERKQQLKKEIEALEGKIDDGKKWLDELAEASEDAWDSIKKGMDSAWDSIRSSFSDATSKFKK